MMSDPFEFFFERCITTPFPSIVMDIDSYDGATVINGNSPDMTSTTRKVVVGGSVTWIIFGLMTVAAIVLGALASNEFTNILAEASNLSKDNLDKPGVRDKIALCNRLQISLWALCTFPCAGLGLSIALYIEVDKLDKMLK